jgi:hypothetical protein
MTKSTLLSAAIIATIIISCKQNKKETVTVPETETKSYANLEKVNWLVGSWGHTSPEGTLAENWVQANDSLYKGESFFIVGKDTVFAEYIDLGESNGKLTCTVSVKGHNNEKPVPFGMTSINDKTIVFENPSHDFPSKITYNKINNDSLVAVITGVQKGKPASETFAMKRQK